MGWACRLNPKSDCDSKRKKERQKQMTDEVARSLKRFGRGLLAILIAGVLAYANKDPKWLIFAPVIQALAKYLRDKFGIINIPV